MFRYDHITEKDKFMEFLGNNMVSEREIVRGMKIFEKNKVPLEIKILR